MFERIGSVSIIIGTVLGSIAILWLIERLLRVLFTRGSWKLLKRPMTLMLVSLLLTGVPLLVNYAMTHFSSLGPLNKIVSGERHLTLTGWDRNDYSVIATLQDTVVLQMANADVTDETLQLIKGMQKLRELDLNNSQVTDKGLAVLASLPNLRDLRLARTKITDDGFRFHLMEKESLKSLELTGTNVASKTIREWKVKESDRKAVK